MTAYVVLSDHPLPAGGSGPAITVTAADAAAYTSDQRQGQSVVRVTPGEKLTERQALEAMLIPSGNNIASCWPAGTSGSEAAFVAKMNARARSFGLSGTRYADASGADPVTASTAADQFLLTVPRCRSRPFARSWQCRRSPCRLPAWRTTSMPRSGHDGVVGVKTGSKLAGRRVPGLRRAPDRGGQPRHDRRRSARRAGTPAQPSELGGVISASENLLASVGGDLEHVQIVRPGAVLGSVSSAWTYGPAAVAATGVAVTAWPGTPVTIAVTPRPLGHAIREGQSVAEATVTVGSQVSHITLDASRAAPAPSIGWLLTRL